jgi:hypothetical protein
MNARHAYRATFEEYGRKLNALECLMNSGVPDEIESARLEVEKARVAHSAARDELAIEVAGARSHAPLRPKEVTAGAALTR